MPGRSYVWTVVRRHRHHRHVFRHALGLQEWRLRLNAPSSCPGYRGKASGRIFRPAQGGRPLTPWEALWQPCLREPVPFSAVLIRAAAALLSMFPGPSCPATGFFICASPVPLAWGPSFSCPSFPVSIFRLSGMACPYSLRGGFLSFVPPVPVPDAKNSYFPYILNSYQSFLFHGGGEPLPLPKDGDQPYRPEQRFFGVGWGTGEEGQFL